jgi:16S rRNA (uracil1498-N3)-methyltransferase
MIGIVDGNGISALAQVIETGKGTLRARIFQMQPSAMEDRLPLLLGIAWIKSVTRLDWIIEKGTELGVCAFHIFGADRSVRRPVRNPAGRCERWRARAKAAMKQSRRAWWPRVRLHDSLEELLDTVAQARVLVAHPGGVGRIDGRAIAAGSDMLLLLVGPEGGFTPREGKLLTACDALRIDLGPRRLRSETAALALCTLVGGAVRTAHQRAGGTPSGNEGLVEE